MIILFHCLSILFFQLLRNRKRIKFLQRIQENKLKTENSSTEHVDLEYNLKFDPPVYLQRYGRVYETLLDERWRKEIKTLVDFGCAEFGLLVFIKRLSSLNHILFVDIDESLLRDYSYKVHPLTIEFLKRREQPLDVSVYAGSVSDPDYRLLKIDSVTAVELIEHLYPDILDAFPYNVFGFIEPKLVIVTTPNADFNVLFSDNLKRFRHHDHKFEWSREQFEEWATNITVRFPDYSVSFSGIGEGPGGTEHLGRCSQMAVFVRKDLLDDKFTSKVYGVSCTCDGDSPCKGLTAESKLLCSCVCALCCPSASYGVCTYHSYSKQIISYEIEQEDEQFVSYNIYYKFITKIQYPFDCDYRSEEEKMMDDFRYRINYYGQPWTRFYVEERSRAEIPLQELVQGADGRFITEQELHKLLNKFGYQIEECRIQETGLYEQCVVYNPLMGEISSASEASGYDSDHAKYQLNEESLSDWDEPCVKKEDSKPVEAYQDNKDISRLEMTSHHSQLEAPTELEDDKKQQDSLFDSGYQKSLSLVDDSPQTPLEDLEETDLFEDTVSTPSLTSEDNKVHLKRAAMLEKCSFVPQSPEKLKVDPNRINELDRYRNMPSGKALLSFPLPPPPPEAYRKSFLKDKDPLPGPSSSVRKRKKFKKGLASDSDDDSPLADVKSIATCILENTLNRIDVNEKDELIEYVVPGIDIDPDAIVLAIQVVNEAAQEAIPVVENGDLANNNRDIEDDPPQFPVEDPEETDQFEDTTSTPSLSSQDNRVHRKRAAVLERSSSSITSPHKLKTVNSNRINELDIYGNMPMSQTFFYTAPRYGGGVSMRATRETLPGQSATPRKKKKITKKDPVTDDDDDDTPFADAMSVATCILHNSLNIINVDERIEYIAPAPGVVPLDQQDTAESEESASAIENKDLDSNNRDEMEGNNYIAQDEADDNVGNDIANDNLEVEEVPRIEEEEENANNVDNNNERAEALQVIEDPPVVVEEPANAVAKASREALFDPSSEQDLLEDFEIPAPLHEADVEEDPGSIQLFGIRLVPAPENLETDQSTNDGFPNWLLQILGAQAVLEEVTPPGSQEGSHFYCQGDGLGVHPSVIAVEVDEDESTDSSNSTADYDEAEQGSSQDMTPLPEDSQTNTQENQEAFETDEENMTVTTSEQDHYTDSNSPNPA